MHPQRIMHQHDITLYLWLALDVVVLVCPAPLLNCMRHARELRIFNSPEPDYSDTSNCLRSGTEPDLLKLHVLHMMTYDDWLFFGGGAKKITRVHAVCLVCHACPHNSFPQCYSLLTKKLTQISLLFFSFFVYRYKSHGISTSF